MGIEQEMERFYDHGKKAFFIAEQILANARNTLLLHLRFMENAFSRFRLMPYIGTLETDGEYIFFNPYYVIQTYRKNPRLVVHQYLHMVIHCVFRHFYGGSVEREFWDLACDIATEAVIAEFQLNCVVQERFLLQRPFLIKLQYHAKSLSAVNLYAYFRSGGLSDEELQQMRDMFSLDCHDAWYRPMMNVIALSGEGESDEEHGSDKQGTSSEKQSGEKSFTIKRRRSYPHTPKSRLSDTWKDVSQKVQTDMETFSKAQGDQAGNMMQNLRELNREKCDYTAFLQKFAVYNEAMHVNDDEFDYLFYTYGMQTYGNMPLVEPLEYKDIKQIKEFVIAIDTSGSVIGETVQNFVQKTYNILKSTESFSSRVNLHILQCDTQIQEVRKITSQEEFETFLQNMTIRGGGGTDFRPIFSYVDKMIDAGEFTNLKGIILFTDGFGDFPKKAPAYETAVVFVDKEDASSAPVPSWAIQLFFTADEIKNL